MRKKLLLFTLFFCFFTAFVHAQPTPTLSLSVESAELFGENVTLTGTFTNSTAVPGNPADATGVGFFLPEPR